jgi:rare lipoprotein A
LLKKDIKNEKVVQPSVIFNDSVIVIKGLFKPYKKDVQASYYANKFNGRRTASGKKFDNTKYTAAHRKLPFGTKLRVTNESNGKFVLVEVTDRGPFSRGREIDLSRKAFMDITSNKNSGSMKVKIEIAE